MTDKVIPVYVLAGFLGSGKTTLLRRLVDDAQSRGWKPAIVMNETGDVNLDGLMVDAAVPMAEILGGCICCTLSGDLGVELANLAKEFRPDVIWIESTGVAQPLEIMDGVTEASMYERLELRGVVTVVDARHLLDRLRIGTGKTFRLMQEQIRAASLIVLNKIDLVAHEDVPELEAALRGWNAGAEIVRTSRAEVAAEKIYDGERVNTAVCGNDEPGHVHGASCGHRHHEHAGHGHQHVQVLTRYMQGPVDSAAFENFVIGLPQGVYRAKGIVTFRDTANRYLFQYAYRQSDFLPIRPQKTVQDVLVFIGEDYSKAELEAELGKLEG